MPRDSTVTVQTQSTGEGTLPAIHTHTTRTDAHRYAERQSQELGRYRGGDVIVISVGTLVIVLLVIVLVLLIT